MSAHARNVNARSFDRQRWWPGTLEGQRSLHLNGPTPRSVPTRSAFVRAAASKRKRAMPRSGCAELGERKRRCGQARVSSSARASRVAAAKSWTASRRVPAPRHPPSLRRDGARRYPGGRTRGRPEKMRAVRTQAGGGLHRRGLPARSQARDATRARSRGTHRERRRDRQPRRREADSCDAVSAQRACSAVDLDGGALSCCARTRVPCAGRA